MPVNAFLPLDARLMQALSKRNIHQPTPIQTLTIPRILAGESVVYRSPTGTGKTFAYLLPIVHRLLRDLPPEAEPGLPRILIMAPTLELAAQIKAQAGLLLEALPVKAALCLGGGNIRRQAETLKKEKPAIIIGNPNRLLELARLKKLRLSAIHTLTLDEVDRLVASEHIEATERLVASLPAARLNIALSATISPPARESLARLWGKDAAFLQSAETEVMQSLISHWALFSEKREQFTTLRSFLAAGRCVKTLIFARRAEEVELISARLRHHKKHAASLFSGQDKRERKNALEAFRRGEKDILVSSDLAARGLDIEDISHVITIGVEESAEVYAHRAGRAGRNGKKGICVSIGDAASMRRLQLIEKKLGIRVCPKEIYGGKVRAPAPESEFAP